MGGLILGYAHEIRASVSLFPLTASDVFWSITDSSVRSHLETFGILDSLPQHHSLGLLPHNACTSPVLLSCCVDDLFAARWPPNHVTLVPSHDTFNVVQICGSCLQHHLLECFHPVPQST